MTAALSASLRRLAHDDGTRPCLDDGRTSLDRAELLARTTRAAEHLRAHDLRCVALLADNGVDWVVAALATLQAGVTLVPLPPFFTVEQRRHVLRSVRPDGILADDRDALAALTDEPARPFHGSLDLATSRDGRAPPADTARITFTSGSTGTPQGICLSEQALSHVARSLADASGFGPADRHLCTLPLGVLLEEVAGPWRCLLSGARCLVPPPRTMGSCGSSQGSGHGLARALGESRATGAVLVPAMLECLVEALEQGAPPPRDLRLVGVGGAAVPEALLRRAARLGLPVREGYGLSEAGSVVALDLGAQARPGRVGTPLPHARVQVAEDGELLVGGPGLAHGRLDERGVYHPLPLDAAGLYATGDLVDRAADGALRIHGRRRNVFITSYGRNVNPEWVERELLAHPDVAQAVVFGEGLPGPVAVVVPREPDADLPAVRAHVNARLPDYARLGRIVAAPEPFSVTNGQWAATGRPRRDAIAAAYATQLRDAAPLSSHTTT